MYTCSTEHKKVCHLGKKGVSTLCHWGCGI